MIKTILNVTTKFVLFFCLTIGLLCSQVHAQQNRLARAGLILNYRCQINLVRAGGNIIGMEAGTEGAIELKRCNGNLSTRRFSLVVPFSAECPNQDASFVNVVEVDEPFVGGFFNGRHLKLTFAAYQPIWPKVSSEFQICNLTSAVDSTGLSKLVESGFGFGAVAVTPEDFPYFCDGLVLNMGKSVSSSVVPARDIDSYSLQCIYSISTSKKR